MKISSPAWLKRATSKVSDFAKKTFGGAARSFGAALFPEGVTCDLCLSELDNDGRYRLCSECLGNMPLIGDHICLCCGVPLDDESEYCLRCQDTESNFKICRSAFVYEGEARRLIHQFKIGRKTYIASTLGAFMADTFLRRDMFAEIATYVPMTSAELKKRGMNHSELLARDVAERLNLPLLPALVKVKDTPQQKGLGRTERAKNLEGVFTCGFPQVKKRSVLLIDDIFTTGATANECAKVLLKAGAREVCVLTAAITKKKMSFEKDD